MTEQKKVTIAKIGLVKATKRKDTNFCQVQLTNGMSGLTFFRGKEHFLKTGVEYWCNITVDGDRTSFNFLKEEIAAALDAQTKEAETLIDKSLNPALEIKIEALRLAVQLACAGKCEPNNILVQQAKLIQGLN